MYYLGSRLVCRTALAALLAASARRGGRLLQHDLLQDSVQQEPVLSLRVVLHWNRNRKCGIDTQIWTTKLFYLYLYLSSKI